MKLNLIAPCGMNCGICMAYLREKNHCDGCRSDTPKPGVSCERCIIKLCTKRTGKYCFDCDDYPCKRLKQLDKRYRIKYGMSMLENLGFIKEQGIRKFVSKEKERWACGECGQTLCVHRWVCSSCGAERKEPK